MDLRKEAEARVRHKSSENEKMQNAIQKFRSSSRSKIPTPIQFHDSTNVEKNKTPEVARLAAVDFKLNRSRVRANSGDFLMPRWIPDNETPNCQKCKIQFELTNRRHHCRHCGLLVCQDCSRYSLLLPHYFGFRDPQRVCSDCNDILKPMQVYLSNNIANHSRVNNIEVISSENCSVRRHFNLPVSRTLGSEIRKAAYSTHNMFTKKFLKDTLIPWDLLESAKGIAYLTVLKGGFMLTGRFGTGLVIARLDKDETSSQQQQRQPTPQSSHNTLNDDFSSESTHDIRHSSNKTHAWYDDSSTARWSAPSAISTVGLSFGAALGVDVTDYVVILNTSEAVRAFSGRGQVTIGGGIDVAVGPVGRSSSAAYHLSLSSGQTASAYSYAHSRGLFAGVSLEGAMIFSRGEVNHMFYGRPVTPEEILDGTVPPPRAANCLYEALTDALGATPLATHCARPVLTPPKQFYLTAEQREERQREQEMELVTQREESYKLNQQLRMNLYSNESMRSESAGEGVQRGGVDQDLNSDDESDNCGFNDVGSDGEEEDKGGDRNSWKNNKTLGNNYNNHRTKNSNNPENISLIREIENSVRDIYSFIMTETAPTLTQSTQQTPQLIPMQTFKSNQTTAAQHMNKNETHYTFNSQASLQFDSNNTNKLDSPTRNIAAEVNCDESSTLVMRGAPQSSCNSRRSGKYTHIDTIFNRQQLPPQKFDLDNMCQVGSTAAGDATEHNSVAVDTADRSIDNSHHNKNNIRKNNSTSNNNTTIFDSFIRHQWDEEDEGDEEVQHSKEVVEEEGQWVGQNPLRAKNFQQSHQLQQQHSAQLQQHHQQHEVQQGVEPDLLFSL